MKSEVELGFWPYLLGIGALIGGVGWLVHTIKSPTASQRIQLEYLKKQQEEAERKAFIQKAAITGGVILLSLVGIKELLKRR